MQELVNNNSILFTRHDEFMAGFSGDSPVWIDTDKEEVPAILKDYKYPVSSWPVVIDDSTKNELALLTVKLPELMKRLPALCFNNNVKKIAGFYFGGDEMVAEFALICHQKNIEIGCRLDLTLTADGFKVLEANMGSSIGGWQVQSFESVIRQMHAPLKDPETAGRFEARNTQSIYISFLVDNILKHAAITGKEINIYIEIGSQEDDATKAKALVFFDELLRKELQGRGLSGRAVTGNVSSLVLGQHGNLLLDGKRIHAVLVFGMEKGDDKSGLAVLRSFIMDRIYLPDHLGTPMLGDKRNLALLRALAEKNAFSPEENALVLKYIPWTAILENRNVFFRGQEHNLLQLVADCKDRFVIKVARGFQGKNVFIGKYLDQDSWQRVIARALQQDIFIAQELSESLELLAPGRQRTWIPHKLIWGAFGFGKRYGGVWVRMSPVENDLGVINSATGAVEAIVYETRPV